MIEIGTRGGGRAYFLATLCELLGHGDIISISEHPRRKRPTHPRLRYLTAAPNKPKARDQVDPMVGCDQHATVILGSRSRRHRTQREFEAFAPLVPVVSYVIIKQTVLNDFPVDASFGPGHNEELRRLMNLHGEFLADTPRERHALTFNQGGFRRWLA